MKNLFLVFMLAFAAIVVIPSEVQAQAGSIKIDRGMDPDSLYIMLTDTVPSKYRHGKSKWYNIVQERPMITGYREYTAQVEFSGTDAPVPIVIENTLGDTLVWTREGEGNYYGTLVGAFPVEEKVLIFCTPGDVSICAWRVDSEDVIELSTYDVAGDAVDANATYFIHARVYY